MSGWGVQVNLNNRADKHKVPLLVAAPPQIAPGLHAALMGDGRFQIVAVATSKEDVRAKLALRPEAIVVSALLFADPDEFVDVLGNFDGDCHVLLPDGVPPSVQERVQNTPCVRHLFTGDVNFVDLAGKVLETAMTRRQAVDGSSVFAKMQAEGIRMAGWRAIGVWNPQGGVGKSTIAAALAMEAAMRRLPTVLIGLGAPDPVPLALGLRQTPNIMTWRTNPTPENLANCVQKSDTLSVLAGFPGPVALGDYLASAESGPESVKELVNCAAYSGYGVVLLDISAQELAAAALAAVNTLLLVVQPTIQGLLHTQEALRLLSMMAGKHAISQANIHLVVNRYRDSTLQPKEVVQSGGELRPDFPPLAAAVPDDPAIEVALNARQPAYLRSDPLRKAMKSLGDTLFVAAAEPSRQAEARIGKRSRAIGLGPIRIHV